MPDRTEIRALLTERIAALMAQTKRMEDELGRPLDDDFAEQVVDRETDEALDALERSALAEIALTRQAIARLDSGGYGICSSCGNVIAAERLTALPRPRSASTARALGKSTNAEETFSHFGLAGVNPVRFRETRCLVPAFDGALFSQQWKDALWDRFFTGAPARQRRSVERYNIVKRA